MIGQEGFRRRIDLRVDPPIANWPPYRFTAVHGGAVGHSDPPVRIDAVTGERRWLAELSNNDVCETADGALWGFAAGSNELVALRSGGASIASSVQFGRLACSELEVFVVREEGRALMITCA